MMMLTKLEEQFLEKAVEYLPRIAKALESIAEGTVKKNPRKMPHWPTDTDGMKTANNEPTNEQPKKRRGRPPKVKKDIYTLAREKTARRNA